MNSQKDTNKKGNYIGLGLTREQNKLFESIEKSFSSRATKLCLLKIVSELNDSKRENYLRELESMQESERNILFDKICLMDELEFGLYIKSI